MQSHARRKQQTALPIVFSLFLIGAAACGRAPSPLERLVEETRERRTRVKVMLVCIDGAAPDVLAEEMAAGALPAFQSLVGRGSSGILRSRPPILSPAIWTTIATGTPRGEHGITGFERPRDGGPRRLVTSNDRKRLALWNITSPFGVRNGWAGYWVTWPAEPVVGWMLSDRIARSRYAVWLDGTRTDGATYPPGLIDEVGALRVDPASPPMDEIRQIVELTPKESRDLLAIDEPIFGHSLSVLRFAYCTQRSYERMTLDRLDRDGQPDLLGVFLVAADPISHTFWHWYRPGDFPGVDPDEAARLGRAVPGIYRHNDRFLAQLIERVDRDTVIFVVSDHGFAPSSLLPRPLRPGEIQALRRRSKEIGQVAVGQSGMHAEKGLIVAAGGPIRSGVEIRADILDIAPTILALLGLPVASDMPGRVLTDLIGPEFLALHPVRTVPSYEELIERSQPGEAAALGEAELQAQLEALGYVEPARGDGEE